MAPSVYFTSISISLPASSLAFAILNVARTEAIANQTVGLAKCRPTQILEILYNNRSVKMQNMGSVNATVVQIRMLAHFRRRRAVRWP